MNKLYDVIVIGAGPAGSFASYLLSKEGLDVLLIDEKSFPREKICGGLLSRKTLDIIGSWEEELPYHCDINRMNIYNKEMSYYTINTEEILGKTVVRRDFDAFLVDKAISAGTTFKDSIRLTAIKNDNHKIDIETTENNYRSCFLIGADGALSTTAKLLSIRPLFFTKKMGFAYSQEIYVKKNDFDKTAIDFFFIPFFAGLGWCFPLSNGFNVGVGATSFKIRNLRRYYEKFIQDIAKNKKIKIKNINPKGTYIPAGGFCRSLGNERVLLIGDAAGGVDPFSGEGIDHALNSSILCKKSITQSFMNNKLQAYEIYTDLYDSYYKNDKRLSLLFTLLSCKKSKAYYNYIKSNNALSYVFKEIITTNCPYDKVLSNYIKTFPEYIYKKITGRIYE